MRFKFGKSKRLKDMRRSNWHRYFAWRPILITCNSSEKNVYAFLEYVERAGSYDPSTKKWAYKTRYYK